MAATALIHQLLYQEKSNQIQLSSMLQQAIFGSAIQLQ
jgi:hypothetical protein